ncbi:MAG: hemerythrin domain-containing protein [Bacteroidota bacterium]|nr:hemerythrin domain-containing protein [Bacteroidota bacterium]
MKFGTPNRTNGALHSPTQDEENMQAHDPLDILRHEHDRGLQELEKIITAIESIHKNGFSREAFQQIAESVKYVGSEMKKHYEKEERYLFPLLDKHLFESPNKIRYERREMWQSLNELINSIKDIEDGRFHGSTVRDLLQCARQVVEHFRTHINRENDVILPMVKRLLTSAEYVQFGEEIQSVTYH